MTTVVQARLQARGQLQLAQAAMVDALALVPAPEFDDVAPGRPASVRSALARALHWIDESLRRLEDGQ